MMKLITTVAIGMLLATSATAQTLMKEDKFFAGPNIGAGFGGGPTMGVNGGYEFHKNGRLEAIYDHMFMPGTNNLDQLGGNVILQVPTSGYMTPYALTGIGYQWQNGINQGMWNVGAGARLAVTNHMDLDLRYRYVQGFYNQSSNNLVGLGTTFKF